MRALLISYTPPTDGKQNGRTRRTQILLTALKSKFSKIDFLHFVQQWQIDDGIAQKYSPETAWGVAGDVTFVADANRPLNFFTYYISPVFSARSERRMFPVSSAAHKAAVHTALEKRPDLIVVVNFPAIFSVLDNNPTIPILFDMDDIWHRVHTRTCLSKPWTISNFLRLLQLPAIIAAEHSAMRRVTATLVSSSADRKRIARMGAGHRAMILPNGIQAPKTKTPLPQNATVLFLGFHYYHPNAVAAERLIKHIWPLILARLPNAKLLIAGEGTEKFAESAQDVASIELLGFVPNLDELYARTNIICCPITIGGGTRLKLIEAAAYGRPIVSTRVGAEGLDFAAGTEILFGETDQELADGCLTLLNDRGLSERNGMALRQKMLELYESDSVVDQLKAIIEKIV